MPSRGTFGFRDRSGTLVRFDFHGKCWNHSSTRMSTDAAPRTCSPLVLTGFHWWFEDMAALTGVAPARSESKSDALLLSYRAEFKDEG